MLIQIISFHFNRRLTSAVYSFKGTVEILDGYLLQPIGHSTFDIFIVAENLLFQVTLHFCLKKHCLKESNIGK